MFDTLRTRVRRSRREGPLPDSAASLLDDDPALALLAQELGELGGIELAAAPRERTLALLRQELRAQEARGAFSGSPRSIFSRVALGGAALLVAVSIGIFALAGGNGDRGPIAGNSSTSDSLVAGTTTDTRSPDTTGVSVPGTATTQAPGTTQAPSTTQAPLTTVPPTSPETDHPVTTDDRPEPTAPPASVRPRTTTTDEPDTTTTTGSAVMTWEAREDSAKTVVLSVADKIMSGALAGVDTYVSSSAQARLAQMIASLERPSAARIVSVRETSAGARVLLEMTDNVGNAQDGLVEVHRRFYFETRADKNGALITDIYAGPAK